MKKLFSSKKAAFLCEEKVLLICLFYSFYEVVLECTVEQLVEALRYKPDMPQVRFSMG
jgi:hypothetical protein